ncbi:hypothetical protein V5799_021363 [Amblyomma americanum]|uniref:Uncharacterized protein n=1 Tax=Amblyomma americanum TaxID=6943 RepID=A0AAQ4FPY4_AMBAM
MQTRTYSVATSRETELNLRHSSPSRTELFATGNHQASHIWPCGYIMGESSKVQRNRDAVTGAGQRPACVRKTSFVSHGWLSKLRRHFSCFLLKTLYTAASRSEISLPENAAPNTLRLAKLIRVPSSTLRSSIFT